MSENKEFDTGLGDLGEAPAAKLTSQQKAAITRKKNIEAKKLAAAEAAATEGAALLNSAAELQNTPSLEPVVVAAPEKKKHKYAPGQKLWITVQKERGKGGERPVPVNVQGKQYTVPRGVKVQVPAMVVEVLMNAEENVVEWDGKNEISSRTSPSYPTSVHGE